MLIIFEGVDCTGKTTLARRLRTSRDAYLHRGPPTTHPLEEYALSLHERGDSMVCDRWHVGERVWPTIFERGTEYDDAMHNWVESYLLSRGALLVHCTGAPGAVEERIREREEPRYDVVDAIAAFDREVRRSQLPTLTHSVEEPLEPYRVLAVANAVFVSQSCGILADERRVGNWFDPGYWLVGDEPNDDVNALPFVPYPATSGHYLFGLELPWNEIAVSNSVGINLRDTWRYLREPSVVALGNVARDRLRYAGVPHRVVPHPQYVRRFHHARHRDYELAIVGFWPWR